MCGITGIFSRERGDKVVSAMCRALSHRGPDDSGIASLSSVNGEPVAGAFGHQRLAIIDLSAAGHQPMFSPDGRLAITYNGEIYNYVALKAELEREGVKFRSSCDTEVLLMGWWMYGSAFLRRLRGMFAFAIWDSVAGRGYLVRDAFGIKPLYVAERDGDVLFASEVRALLASGVVEPALSPRAIASYLSSGSVAEPLTIIDSVFAVPPGCVVEVASRNGRFEARDAQRFMTAFAESDDIHRELPSHAHRVRNALRESVRHHLVSDVPVAVFLSGGIDSSAVAGLASELSAGRVESFTVTFSEAAFSEAKPAREAARRFNTRHHEIPLTGQDLLSALPEVFAAMDQPSLDGLNTFVVSRAVRSFGIKVVLSGLGGDELFGGYPSFRRAHYISSLWRLPKSMRRAGAAATRAFSDMRADRVRTLLDEKYPAHAAYRASRTLFGDQQVSALTGGRFRSCGFNADPDDVDVGRLSLMQQVSLYELSGYMRNTLLRDSDVFSMSQGLELRVPFVDAEVARAAAAASVGLARARSAKPVLVEAVRDLLSTETTERPKQGFTLPFESWMRDELFSEVDSVLATGTIETLGLDRVAVAGVWNDFLHRRGGMNWSRPWALYTLLRWAAQNGVGSVAKDTEAKPMLELLEASA